MISTSKVLWGEGLFLRPQHFQQQDAYHEWRLAQAVRGLHPYAWGVHHLKVDNDALQAGQLRLLELQMVFPDGEFYNAPSEDALPAPLALDSALAQGTDVLLYAAVAPLRANGSNFSPTREEADTATRYYHVQKDIADQYTDATAAQLSLLGKSVRLLSEHEPRAHLLSLPVLQIRRNVMGGFELDPRYVPPALTIQSSPVVFLYLRRLLDVLQAKIDALYGFHREPSKNIIEFRSGDVASFWLLHTASGAYAALSHLMRHPGLHPERLFQRLLELAGALMTFSRGYTLTDLPAYDHTNPGPAFFKLDHIIRELLETVISTRYFAIALSEDRPSFHQGRLDAQQISGATSFYLGITAAMPSAELVEAVPLRFKIGAPEDVEKLVLSALPGVPITHAAQVPSAIPVRPGSYYFAIEPRGALYERMLQAQAVSLYVPSGIADLKIELIAINA